MRELSFGRALRLTAVHYGDGGGEGGASPEARGWFSIERAGTAGGGGDTAAEENSGSVRGRDCGGSERASIGAFVY